MFKDQPLETKKIQVKAMVARMAQAYGIKKKELPTLLDCQKSQVNNWGYYGRPPYDQLDQCSEKTGVSMGWLLYGEKPKIELTAQSVAQLRIIITKLFADGADYNMIEQVYPGATKQLAQKFESDILEWLAVNDAVVEIPTQQSKQN